MSDSPMFRQRQQLTQPRAVVQVYRKDLNADWGQEQKDLGLLVTNTTATQKKILNVLTVLKGEEPFEPDFGSMVPYRIWQPTNSRTAYLLEGDIIRALQEQMRSDIIVYHNECSVVESEEGETWEVTLVYDEILTGPVAPWTFALSKASFGYK